MNTIENGLIIDKSTNPPSCVGYIFNFSGHGAFAPSGKVEINGVLRDPTQAEIDAHNSILAREEWRHMVKSGRGTMYLHQGESGLTVAPWSAHDGMSASVMRASKSRNNWGAQRTDVWFMIDGATWHGVNIGDNDIVRCNRTKN